MRRFGVTYYCAAAFRAGRGKKIKTPRQKDLEATSRRLHLTACITWSDAETPEAVLGRVSRGGKMCYHS
jgi:hypothetical protein